MLEIVVKDINDYKTLRHVENKPYLKILYCFGNAPSDKLSRDFVDGFVPQLLELILKENNNLELLQSFSWFLNSCLNINLKVYLELQFKMIQ